MNNGREQGARVLKRVGWWIFTLLTFLFACLALRTVLENQPNIITTIVPMSLILIWLIVTYLVMAKKPNQKNNFKKDGWLPMIWLLLKEVIVIISLIYIKLNWNYESDTGGNFGMVVGIGIYIVLIGIVLNIVTYHQSAKEPWQTALIVVTTLCNYFVFMFMPIIMHYML